jgi:hypothetical protein
VRTPTFNTPVEQIQADYNWQQAFDLYAKGFTITDIAKVVVSVDGENDEDNWTGVFELQDGRFCYLDAGCDYTGWG